MQAEHNWNETLSVLTVLPDLEDALTSIDDARFWAALAGITVGWAHATHSIGTLNPVAGTKTVDIGAPSQGHLRTGSRRRDASAGPTCARGATRTQRGIYPEQRVA